MAPYTAGIIHQSIDSMDTILTEADTIIEKDDEKDNNNNNSNSNRSYDCNYDGGIDDDESTYSSCSDASDSSGYDSDLLDDSSIDSDIDDSGDSDGSVYKNGSQQDYNRKRSYPDSESYGDYGFGRGCDGNDSRVRFSVTIKKVDVLSLDDYTEEERKRCWYSRDERRHHTEERNEIVKRMEEGKPPKGEDMTYRGLEGWTSEGSHRISVQVMLIVDAVMDEQESQWNSRTSDVERLAETSRKLSVRSIGSALNRGLEDRKEAVDNQKEDENKSRGVGGVGDEGEVEEKTVFASHIDYLRRKKSQYLVVRTPPERQRSDVDPPGIVLRDLPWRPMTTESYLKADLTAKNNSDGEAVVGATPDSPTSTTSSSSTEGSKHWKKGKLRLFSPKKKLKLPVIMSSKRGPPQ